MTHPTTKRGRPYSGAEPLRRLETWLPASMAQKLRGMSGAARNRLIARAIRAALEAAPAAPAAADRDG